nr:CHRD domain-containing protein [uncultured Flavobacterium sp.]
MRHFYRFLAISIIVLGIVSCDGDGYSSNPTPTPTPNIITFTAVLSGAREVPPVIPGSPAASGNATLAFNNTSKTFTLTVTYLYMTPTTAHIHRGAIGVAGPIVFPTPTTSFTFPITSYTSPALTTAQEADLKAELYYVNIHSATYLDGEIRGQLFKQGTGGGSY